MSDQATEVTVNVTVTFPMGKFDTHRTGSRFDVTNVIHDLLTVDHTFESAEVTYAD